MPPMTLHVKVEAGGAFPEALELAAAPPVPLLPKKEAPVPPPHFVKCKPGSTIEEGGKYKSLPQCGSESW